jgi:hypothetical protein
MVLHRPSPKGHALVALGTLSLGKKGGRRITPSASHGIALRQAVVRGGLTVEPVAGHIKSPASFFEVLTIDYVEMSGDGAGILRC